ncbi:sigma factor-like helix-turn-helix DNA-binding protein [Natranaerobius trueperi]|nr:sigma factor-like helix-turn-helix DNA-binding protein [Natranaerobius trueperi]
MWVLFDAYDSNHIHLKIGQVDEKVFKAQEHYKGTTRLSNEITNSDKKSLLELLSEILIYHPSGLHLKEIKEYVSKYYPYRESSISSVLSKKSFFEKDPQRKGFWRFNPDKWNRNHLEQNNFEEEYELKPLKHYFNNLKEHSIENSTRILNSYFNEYSKEEILDLTYKSYFKTTYDLSNTYSCDIIDPEDYIQESYFALEKAYENFDPNRETSFHNYFLVYLRQYFRRYQDAFHNLIRIPHYRIDELKKIEKILDKDLPLGKDPYNYFIDDKTYRDYLLWKLNYISFDQLYGYSITSSHVEDEQDLNYLNRMLDNLFYDGTYLIGLDEQQTKTSIVPFIKDREFYYDNLTRNKYYETYDKACNSVNPELEENFELSYEGLYEHDDFIEDIANKDLVNKLFSYLESKDGNSNYSSSDILKLRYGFYNDEPLTLQEVGDKFDITRERVRQIEERSFNRALVYFSINPIN